MFSLMMLAGGWQTGARWCSPEGGSSLFSLRGAFNPFPTQDRPDLGRARIGAFRFAVDECRRQAERYGEPVLTVPPHIYARYF